MGDPVTASIVGGAKVAEATIGGLQAKNQAKTQQYQLQTQKKAIEANAANEEWQRLSNLNSILSTQKAIMAGRGQTTGFGSAMVISQESMNQAAIEQQQSNLQQKVNQSAIDYNISSAKRAASGALMSSYLGAAFDMAGQWGRAAMSSSFEKPSSGGGK